MQELQKQLAVLDEAVRGAVKTLKIAELEKELDEIESTTAGADFWADPFVAQEVMKRQAQLQGRVKPWKELQKSLQDVTELAGMDDASLQGDLEKQYQDLQMQFDALRDQLKFSGAYDSYDVILSIRAGAGGTDAQDWTQMLLRMYAHWAEKQQISMTTIDQSAGEEAGLKSVTIQLGGEFLYGKLKGENGVHRLVRLSPFNSDSLRQTSFAKVDVLPKIDQPNALEIDEKELKVDVYRAGGHGGQSVNTTDSAVRITHLPTGITVAIQNERSQLQNKETAMTILRSRLAALKLEQHKESLAELKGPNQSAEWGNQIRSYVLHPYTMVKDLRTRQETSDAQGVLDGNLDPFINAYLDFSLKI